MVHHSLIHFESQAESDGKSLAPDFLTMLSHTTANLLQMLAMRSASPPAAPKSRAVRACAHPVVMLKMLSDPMFFFGENPKSMSMKLFSYDGELYQVFWLVAWLIGWLPVNC